MSLMMVPGVLGQQGGFNPLTEIDWVNAWWAEDPEWTNPGDGNNITSLRGAGSDPADWTVATPAINTTFEESTPSLNNQPSIFVSGGTNAQRPDLTLPTLLNEDWSLVIIGVQDALSGGGNSYYTDATAVGGGKRVIISPDGAVVFWRFYSGAGSSNTPAAAGTGVDTDAHLFVAVSSSTTVNMISVDGDEHTATQIASSIKNLFIGSITGNIPFMGLYQGDVTGDANWSNITDWAEDHYGIVTV